MHSNEHFVTLFDCNFLPYAICLHQSLLRHCPQAHLWIVCMDDKVGAAIQKLGLLQTTCIPLAEVEGEDLLRVKKIRSRGEYCWTLTPFTFGAVFARCPEAKRVTYLDSDIYFFGDPLQLIGELTSQHKGVLITDHAYAPEYDVSSDAGRFCVQFITCLQTPAARAVIDHWGQQCLEWCYARFEDGKFGDQKYLDAWPRLYPQTVHVVEQRQLTLAPWNVAHYLGTVPGLERPVIYHFQGLRFLNRHKVRLFSGYKIGPKGRALYREYCQVLAQAVATLEAQAIPWTVIKPVQEKFAWVRQLKRTLSGTIGFAKLSSPSPLGQQT